MSVHSISAGKPRHAAPPPPLHDRLEQPVEFGLHAGGALSVKFTYTFLSSDEVHFALYYPFSYCDCQRLLGNIDKAIGNAGVPGSAAAATAAAAARRGRRRAADPPPGQGVYYHRELLTHSLEGRRVELLTITALQGIAPDRQPRLPGLFPDADTPRPHRFPGRTAIYIGARVHPGETAASYMLHGLLAFLLQPRNPYARALRQRFLFNVVPMLNPDGVFWGHFRTDTLGVNLNRQYAAPHPSKAPSIHAVRELLKHLAATCAPAPPESLRAFRERFIEGTPPPSTPPSSRSQRSRTGRRGGGGALQRASAMAATASSARRVRGGVGGGAADTPSTPPGLWMCLDLHGYTARRGCYTLANATNPPLEARSLVFTNLLQLHAPQFNADACGYGRSLAARRGVEGGPKPPSKRAAYATPYGSDVLGKASAVSGGGGDTPPATPSPGYTRGTPDSRELWAADVAGVVDPWALQRQPVPRGLSFGCGTALLPDAEAVRINREWGAFKARITAKTEGNKAGAGRVWMWKELRVPHAYTVEGSCNLLSHTRVFARAYAAPALHGPMLEGVGPCTGPPVVTPQAPRPPSPKGLAATAASFMGTAPLRSPGGGGADTPPPPPSGATTVIQCPRASAPLLSQVYPLPGMGGGCRWRPPPGAPDPPSKKPPISAVAAGTAPLPLLTAQPLHRPYLCQVGSLQPPSTGTRNTPPFGFPCTPPAHATTPVEVPLYPAHHAVAGEGGGTAPHIISATATCTCSWGTCPHDPPAAFAGVGRGLALAMVELSGGLPGATSRLRTSVWGSLEALHRWARRRVALAAGLPPPSDAALADSVGGAPPRRGGGPRRRGGGTSKPTPPAEPTPPPSPTGSGTSSTDGSGNELTPPLGPGEPPPLLPDLPRDVSPATPEGDGAAADPHPMPLTRSHIPMAPFSAADTPAHPIAAGQSTDLGMGRRAHLGRMRPPAALGSDPAAYLGVAAVGRSEGGGTQRPRGGGRLHLASTSKPPHTRSASLPHHMPIAAGDSPAASTVLQSLTLSGAAVRGGVRGGVRGAPAITRRRSGTQQAPSHDDGATPAPVGPPLPSRVRSRGPRDGGGATPPSSSTPSRGSRGTPRRGPKTPSRKGGGAESVLARAMQAAEGRGGGAWVAVTPRQA